MIVKPAITNATNINDCFLNVFQIISKMKGSEGRNVLLDLSEINFASPAFVIPLFSYLSQTNADFEVKLSEELLNMSFPSGLEINRLRPLLLKSRLNEYISKDYLPLVVFPTNSGNEDETSTLVNIVESALYKQLGSATNIVNGLRYIIGEIIDNITQHSKSPVGYFYSKINRAKEYVEVAISDIGIGLLGSYNDSNDIDIISDIEALQAANRGISTKNLPNAENRGYGIITSKKMVIDGLDGFYCMISGNAMLLKTPSYNQYLDLGKEINFRGTIVIFRIPLESESFNYIKYIE